MKVDEQRVIWDGLADVGVDAAVVDLNDKRGDKNRYIIELRNALMLGHIDRIGARDVLDFGCGTGNFSRAMLRHGLQPIGVDISHGLLSAGSAQRHGGEPWLAVQYDGLRLPFDTARFDAITTYVVLNYLADDAHFAEITGELYRVLRPGGVLLAAEQVTSQQRFSAATGKLQRSPAAFRKLFEAAGFRTEAEQTFRFGHFPLIYLIRYGLLPRALWRAIGRLEAWWGSVRPLPRFDYADRLFVARKPH